MCVNSTTVYNRAKMFGDMSVARISTSCGYCPECRSAKINSYLLRCFAELRYIQLNGGFVYFDTLTYDDEHLPVDFGVSHFRRSDITCYIRNLRKTLKKEYSVENDSFKYLLTCEYGERKDATHRPHYHVIFFVHDKRLTPASFHKIMREKWPHGETDIKHNRDYTKGIVFMRGFQPKFPPIMAMKYVCKYVCKDLTLKNKIDSLELDDLSVLDHIEFKPFIAISKSFGECALDDNYGFLGDLVDKGYFETLDYKGNVIKLPFSSYLYRKYFYHTEYIINERGEKVLRWIKNSAILAKYKLAHLDKRIDDEVSRIKSMLSANVPALNTLGFSRQGFIDEFHRLLGDRSIRDFVIYKNIYRNRVSFENINLNYKHAYVKDIVNDPILCLDAYGIDRQGNRRFLDSHIINDSFHPLWHDFDSLYVLFDNLRVKYSVYRAEYNEELYNLKKHLKSLYEH